MTHVKRPTDDRSIYGMSHEELRELTSYMMVVDGSQFLTDVAAKHDFPRWMDKNQMVYHCVLGTLYVSDSKDKTPEETHVCAYMHYFCRPTDGQVVCLLYRASQVVHFDMMKDCAIEMHPLVASDRRERYDDGGGSQTAFDMWVEEGIVRKT